MKCIPFYALTVDKPYPNAYFWAEVKQSQLFRSHQLYRPPSPVSPKEGFLGGSNGKKSACNAGDLDSTLGLGRSPAGGHGNPFQYSPLENPHGQGSLAGYHPWGRKDSDMTEQLSLTHMHTHMCRHTYMQPPHVWFCHCSSVLELKPECSHKIVGKLHHLSSWMFIITFQESGKALN